MATLPTPVSFPGDWPVAADAPASAIAPPSGPDAGPCVNWLFVDLNSYFASVEQQERAELRGRPVAVVPMMADTTCCIAASYEAKAFGVKTGTIVADAKRMCPEIVLIEGRHDIYTKYHHRIVEVVESCVPVTAVCSIDEMACRLIGRERPLLAALALGRKVKAAICERVGPMMRSSVGLATNRFLAKIASDMEKPNGLVALTLDILPEALRQLTLRDLPGVGARMEKRLNGKGITTMEQLLALDSAQFGEVWGSVWGERMGHWLRGEDFGLAENEHQKSISHSHVLAPEMRTAEKAWAVAHKLLHKAAMRLRTANLWASGIGLAIGFSVPRGQQAPVSRFGVPTRGWHSDLKLSECQDNPTLIAALSRLWASRPAGAEFDTPYFVGVQLTGLVPDRLHSLNLFDALEETEGRTRLLAAMDALNHKYGANTLAPAAILTAYKAAPTRIAFTSIPDLF
ncbi:MAG TPA: DNA polymerase [Terracidiphilus sp.]|jgi:DNA polymerase-4|nr:DNA polymerase [Terracidiphilus sp.]